MRYHSLATLAVFCFALGVHAPQAQTAPSAHDEAVLRAWLASPHADSESEAFRHWDNEAEIPGTCAVCHSTTGVVDYLAGPQTKAAAIDHSVPIGTTVECAACHTDGAKALTGVLFPNGQVVSNETSSAVCSVCHQGRSSMDQVTAAIGTLEADSVSPDLRFINIHYAAAASTQLGAEVRGGFQYEGKIYAGPFGHVQGLNSCVSCHGAHETTVRLESCTTCHQGAVEFSAIRTTPVDILGDGNTSAGMGVVIDTLHGRLNEAIMAYATQISGVPIAYSVDAYPYFFNDLNADGLSDATEAVFPNAYQSWTPRLLQAAYNYQFVGKDHGAFAHNPHYATQLLIDSIEDLATVAEIDASGLTRP